MCGRIACTLDPSVICKACSYRQGGSSSSSTGTFAQPKWTDHPPPKDDSSSASYAYYPSANVAPTKFTPVLFKRSQNEEEGGVLLQPMMFGMIPAYHKGEAKSHGLSTNNCRLEGLLESKLYRKVLDKRNCCVVVAQGFYEWKTVGAEPKKQKQPYLIFAPQGDKKEANVADKSAWEEAEWSEEEGWKGPAILKMAGLYDVWKSPNGDEVYSYTIITMESNKTLSWLHDRMPAILETEEQVQGWLSATPKTDTKELLSILKPASSLEWYTVDPKVGNSRCHDMDCIQPKEIKENKSKTFMDNWLKKKPEKTKAEDDPADASALKKPKMEQDETQ